MIDLVSGFSQELWQSNERNGDFLDGQIYYGNVIRSDMEPESADCKRAVRSLKSSSRKSTNFLEQKHIYEYLIRRDRRDATE